MELTKIINQDGLFVKATGTAEAIGLGSKETQVDKGENEEIGKYAVNNGVVSFISPDQNRWVGIYTERAIEALQKAGYARGNIYVPHSNDAGAGIRRLMARN